VDLTFLAPGAALLAAAALLPLAAHMTRRAPTTRIPFGATLLLERMVKRLRRRRRIVDPLLLLLRILLVAALVGAAVGPVLTLPTDAPEFGGTGRVVVVVDRSRSMALQQEGASLLEQATGRARTFLSELPPGTRAGLVFYGDDARPARADLVDPSELDAGAWQVTPEGSSQLRAGLLEARRLLGGEPGEIVVFTDEAGPLQVPEAQEELGRIVAAGSAVLPRPIAAEPPRNAAIIHAAYGDGIEGGLVSFTVRNYGDEARELACIVELPDGASIPVFAAPEANGTAEVRVTVPRKAEGGVASVQCDDDALAGDDERYFHLPQIGASRVLVINGDPGDTPTNSETYFLERALSPWGGLRTGVRPDVVPSSGADKLESGEYAFAIVANVSDPSAMAPALSAFVQQGGTLFLSMGSNVSTDRYNKVLGDILPSELQQRTAIASPGEDGVPLAVPDLEHPVFAPFQRGGGSAFRRVRTSRVVSLKPSGDDVSVLLEYEGGVPALVHKQVGRGNVFLWTSTLDVHWTNFPLQSVYMPLVQGLVQHAAGGSAFGSSRTQGIVGETVRFALPEGVLEPEIFGPNGDRARARVEGSEVRFEPTRAGAYRIEDGSGATLSWVAVNPSLAESDVRRGPSLAAAEAELDPDLFSRRIPMAGWLLALALLLTLAQGLLGANAQKEDA